MGRATKQQAAENRERVLAEASRMFRERGLSGVGIAELMAAAGLTHGGFYRQFGSKEALAAEACAQSMQGSAAAWREALARDPDAAAAIVDKYLRAGSDNRCAMPMLASDVGREAPGSPVRAAYTEGVRAFAAALAPDGDRAAALALLAAMVGAVSMARALDDPALVEEITAAVRGLVRPAG